MNIINVIDNSNVPAWGNQMKYIVAHYLGVVGQNNRIDSGGYGAHYYIYWDGTIYQAASHDAVLWQVGTAGYYTQKHPEANNYNCIGIEMCPKCDGNSGDADDPKWYFTTETQEACIQLVKHLMSELGIAADHVLRHYDIVNKHCPAPYVNNNRYRTSWTWDEFKAKLAGGSASPSITTNTTGGNKYMFNTDQVMMGSNNNSVLLLEEILGSRGYYEGALDKNFGPGLRDAVMKYQHLRNMAEDGICGPATWADLIAL
ncbi:MAG: peptidoglycan-binding domain-containing protein [Lachnospiraceae bacterium]|nr:peptidoglycan-binding domain-containing protein [Lachnospiraceae bacterium]